MGGCISSTRSPRHSRSPQSRSAESDGGNPSPQRQSADSSGASMVTDDSSPVTTTPHAASSTYANQVFCDICFSNPIDVAFGCGHRTCSKCGGNIYSCPFCRDPILNRVKLSCESDQNQCCLCGLTNLKVIAFDCGHQTCFRCGQTVQSCPICGSIVENRITLY